MSVMQTLTELDRIRRRIAISALTESGVGYGAFAALDHMDRFKLTRATDIARSVNISNATVVTLLQRMEHDGMILRAPDPEDGRASVVGMTDYGRSLLKRGRLVMVRLEAMMTDEIDPDLLIVIGSVAKRISRNLSEASYRQLRDLAFPDQDDMEGPGA